MAIVVLTWRNNEAEANDVNYKLRQDDDTGWWWAHAHLSSVIQPIRLKGANNRGTREDAMRIAQEDAEKRGETDNAREPQIKRVRA